MHLMCWISEGAKYVQVCVGCVQAKEQEACTVLHRGPV